MISRCFELVGGGFVINRATPSSSIPSAGFLVSFEVVSPVTGIAAVLTGINSVSFLVDFLLMSRKVFHFLSTVTTQPEGSHSVLLHGSQYLCPQP